MRQLKVLVSAYACEPEKGSEPGVGWNWAKQIANFAEVWVIARANNRDSVEKELERNLTPNLHFVFYDVPRWLSFWKKKKRGVHPYYFLWQLGVYRLAQRLNKELHFDLVHHLTFGNVWLPTFMPLLPIPFIWGPIGGGERVPKAFRQNFNIKSKIREFIRDMIINSLKLNLLFQYTCQKADLIIVKTSDTASRIPLSSRNKVTVTTDVALETNGIAQKTESSPNLKIIAVGTLDPWRGFDLLVEAFADVAKEHRNIELIILGEGQERDRLERMIKESHLQDRVSLIGQVERSKYLEYLANSSIFVNPCLKEGGVTVLFEALAFGLPVICMDIPGSSEIVTDDCGKKVRLLNPNQVINDIANTLTRFINNTEQRNLLNLHCSEKFKESLSWHKKGQEIRAFYEEVLEKRYENFVRT